jgi:hypothetical protein
MTPKNSPTSLHRRMTVSFVFLEACTYTGSAQTCLNGPSIGAGPDGLERMRDTVSWTRPNHIAQSQEKHVPGVTQNE